MGWAEARASCARSRSTDANNVCERQQSNRTNNCQSFKFHLTGNHTNTYTHTDTITFINLKTLQNTIKDTPYYNDTNVSAAAPRLTQQPIFRLASFTTITSIATITTNGHHHQRSYARSSRSGSSPPPPPQLSPLVPGVP